MPFMVWNDQLSVSIEAIDTDHKQLVAILNELYDAIHAGHGREAVTEIIERLVDYTRYHFAREEELFSSTGYLDAAAHKREHDAMVAWVTDLRERMRNGTVAAPSFEVVCYLKDWLFHHVIASDQKYAPHLKAMGIR
jgi:hemerythrin